MIGDTDGEGEGAGPGVLAEAEPPLLGEGHHREVEQPLWARARYRQQNVETWNSQKKCFFRHLETVHFCRNKRSFLPQIWAQNYNWCFISKKKIFTNLINQKKMRHVCFDFELKKDLFILQCENVGETMACSTHTRQRSVEIICHGRGRGFLPRVLVGNKEVAVWTRCH